MSPQQRLIAIRELLAAQDTLYLVKEVMGCEMLMKRARQADDLAALRDLRRRRRQIMEELKRRKRDGS